MMRPVTWEALWRRYDACKAIADQLDARFMARADACLLRAGLSSDIGMAWLQAHNARVDKHYGKPWRGVDYALIHQAYQWREKAWSAARPVSALYSRLYDEWRADGFQYERRVAA